MAVQTSLTVQRTARDSVDLLGTRVDRVPLPAVSEWIATFITSGEPHQIVTANLDFIATARKRPSFARVIDAADLVVCDGKPLQWAAQVRGVPIPARVTGTHIILETARLSAERGYRLFLLGAAPSVAERAGRALEAAFPGAVIAGSYSPPLGEFDAAENAKMVEMIRAARTDALFVALGAPRQDEWIREHLHALGVPLCVGVGGVFNFLAGETRRAPDWIQRAGMEWAYRLTQEPTRLWRRYVVNDLPVFFTLLADQAIQRLQATTSDGDDENTLHELAAPRARTVAGTVAEMVVEVHAVEMAQTSAERARE